MRQKGDSNEHLTFGQMVDTLISALCRQRGAILDTASHALCKGFRQADSDEHAMTVKHIILKMSVTSFCVCTMSL